MRRAADRHAAFALLLAVTACAHEPPPSSPGPAPQAVSPATSYPAELAERLTAVGANYPGVAFAVVGPSGVIWQGATGVADTGTGAAITAQTPVSAYSVNKPMTATVAMWLVEQGKLDLDRPIGELAAVPPAFATLTSRELLTHTSGIRDYRKGEWLPNALRSCAAPKDALAAFASDPLGARGAYRYSTFNFELLSHVLESVAGEPFNEMMTQRVFAPAGMSHASLWQVGLRRPPNGHERVGATFRAARAIDNSCKYGAGSVVASAEDLARFGASLWAGRLISKTTWRAMTAGAKNNYGLGWGVGALEDGSPVAAHSGSAIGGTSAIVIDMERGISVGMVGNAEGPSLVAEAKAILALARKSPGAAGQLEPQ